MVLACFIHTSLPLVCYNASLQKELGAGKIITVNLLNKCHDLTTTFYLKIDFPFYFLCFY
jgi:hypothetical protein